LSKYAKLHGPVSHRRAVRGARKIWPLLKEMLPRVKSAVDVGCGIGSWLSVLNDDGVQDILGIDGDWVNRKNLAIPEECFHSHDLAEPFTFDRKFDLAMSLEVAEHLPQNKAGNYIDSLVALSDFILFSAAVPWQLGIGHVNEQWPEYWEALFKDRGYRVCDVIRGRIWREGTIPVWYRQNLLLYVKEDRLDDLHLNGVDGSLPLSWIHPVVFKQRARAARYVLAFRHVIPTWMISWVRRRFRL
jgi:hypothetical protein